MPRSVKNQKDFSKGQVSNKHPSDIGDDELAFCGDIDVNSQPGIVQHPKRFVRTQVDGLADTAGPIDRGTLPDVSEGLRNIPLDTPESGFTDVTGGRNQIPLGQISPVITWDGNVDIDAANAALGYHALHDVNGSNYYPDSTGNESEMLDNTTSSMYTPHSAAFKPEFITNPSSFHTYSTPHKVNTDMRHYIEDTCTWTIQIQKKHPAPNVTSTNGSYEDTADNPAYVINNSELFFKISKGGSYYYTPIEMYLEGIAEGVTVANKPNNSLTVLSEAGMANWGIPIYPEDDPDDAGFGSDSAIYKIGPGLYFKFDEVVQSMFNLVMGIGGHKWSIKTEAYTNLSHKNAFSYGKSLISFGSDRRLDTSGDKCSITALISNNKVYGFQDTVKGHSSYGYQVPNQWLIGDLGETVIEKIGIGDGIHTRFGDGADGNTDRTRTSKYPINLNTFEIWLGGHSDRLHPYEMQFFPVSGFWNGSDTYTSRHKYFITSRGRMTNASQSNLYTSPHFLEKFYILNDTDNGNIIKGTTHFKTDCDWWEGYGGTAGGISDFHSHFGAIGKWIMNTELLHQSSPEPNIQTYAKIAYLHNSRNGAANDSLIGVRKAFTNAGGYFCNNDDDPTTSDIIKFCNNLKDWDKGTYTQGHGYQTPSEGVATGPTESNSSSLYSWIDAKSGYIHLNFNVPPPPGVEIFVKYRSDDWYRGQGTMHYNDRQLRVSTLSSGSTGKVFDFWDKHGERPRLISIRKRTSNPDSDSTTEAVWSGAFDTTRRAFYATSGGWAYTSGPSGTGTSRYRRGRPIERTIDLEEPEALFVMPSPGWGDITYKIGSDGVPYLKVIEDSPRTNDGSAADNNNTSVDGADYETDGYDPYEDGGDARDYMGWTSFRSLRLGGHRYDDIRKAADRGDPYYVVLAPCGRKDDDTNCIQKMPSSGWISKWDHDASTGGKDNVGFQGSSGYAGADDDPPTTLGDISSYSSRKGSYPYPHFMFRIRYVTSGKGTVDGIDVPLTQDTITMGGDMQDNGDNKFYRIVLYAEDIPTNYPITDEMQCNWKILPPKGKGLVIEMHGKNSSTESICFNDSDTAVSWETSAGGEHVFGISYVDRLGQDSRIYYNGYNAFKMYTNTFLRWSIVTHGKYPDWVEKIRIWIRPYRQSAGSWAIMGEYDMYGNMYKVDLASPSRYAAMFFFGNPTYQGDHELAENGVYDPEGSSSDYRTNGTVTWAFSQPWTHHATPITTYYILNGAEEQPKNSVKAYRTSVQIGDRYYIGGIKYDDNKYSEDTVLISAKQQDSKLKEKIKFDWFHEGLKIEVGGSDGQGIECLSGWGDKLLIHKYEDTIVYDVSDPDNPRIFETLPGDGVHNSSAVTVSPYGVIWGCPSGAVLYGDKGRLLLSQKLGDAEWEDFWRLNTTYHYGRSIPYPIESKWKRFNTIASIVTAYDPKSNKVIFIAAAHGGEATKNAYIYYFETAGWEFVYNIFSNQINYGLGTGGNEGYSKDILNKNANWYDYSTYTRFSGRAMTHHMSNIVREPMSERLLCVTTEPRKYYSELSQRHGYTYYTSFGGHMSNEILVGNDGACLRTENSIGGAGDEADAIEFTSDVSDYIAVDDYLMCYCGPAYTRSVNSPLIFRVEAVTTDTIALYRAYSAPGVKVNTKPLLYHHSINQGDGSIVSDDPDNGNGTYYDLSKADNEIIAGAVFYKWITGGFTRGIFYCYTDETRVGSNAWTMITREYDLDSPGVRKKLYNLKTRVKSGMVDANHGLDAYFATDGSVLDENTSPVVDASGIKGTSPDVYVDVEQKFPSQDTIGANTNNANSLSIMYTSKDVDLEDSVKDFSSATVGNQVDTSYELVNSHTFINCTTEGTSGSTYGDIKNATSDTIWESHYNDTSTYGGTPIIKSYGSENYVCLRNMKGGPCYIKAVFSSTVTANNLNMKMYKGRLYVLRIEVVRDLAQNIYTDGDLTTAGYNLDNGTAQNSGLIFFADNSSGDGIVGGGLAYYQRKMIYNAGIYNWYLINRYDDPTLWFRSSPYAGSYWDGTATIIKQISIKEMEGDYIPPDLKINGLSVVYRAKSIK